MGGKLKYCFHKNEYLMLDIFEDRVYNDESGSEEDNVDQMFFEFVENIKEDKIC